MKLKDVIKGVQVEGVEGSVDIDITGVAYDSRQVEPGFLFVCIDGVEDDGHKYLNAAQNAGASAAIVTKEQDNFKGTVVMTTDSRKALAKCAVNFYDNPSEKLHLIGITGTKGKTTTAFMIKSILDKSGTECGIMGNLGVAFKGRHIATSQNTQQSSDLQKYFRMMVDSGTGKCVMEVTSMGLKQYRTSYVKFDIGMFTNISRAHIGRREHADFQEYLDSKAMLFSMCEKAVINMDDENSDYIADKTQCPVATISLEKEADVTAVDMRINSKGSTFLYDGMGKRIPIKLAMPGKFNVYNALFAATAALMSGADEEMIKDGLSDVVVPGRCERIPTGREFGIMIDYAHSPDSLAKLLEAMNEFAQGRVISVFGCGGDRDATMRPMMGEISGELADFTIITTDNPRFEKPMDIMLQIEEGMKKTDGEYIMIEDRTKAIEYAIKNAKANDLIILAGKGHETYLDKMGVKTHYDEREIVSRILEGVG